MLATVDWYGISAVIAAVGAAAATVIGALNHRTATSVARSVATNGDPRTLGQLATDVAAAVAPTPAQPSSATDTPASSTDTPPPAH